MWLLISCGSVGEQSRRSLTSLEATFVQVEEYLFEFIVYLGLEVVYQTLKQIFVELFDTLVCEQVTFLQ